MKADAMRKNTLFSLITLSVLSSHHASALSLEDIVSQKTLESGTLAALGCVLLRNQNIPSYIFGGTAIIAAGVNQYVFELKHAKKTFLEWHETSPKKRSVFQLF